LRLRTDDLSWRDVDDDVVVLDETTWKYVHLNASASVLWRALATGEQTEEELVAHLAQTFPAAPDAAADVTAFLSDLRERGYLDA